MGMGMAMSGEGGGGGGGGRGEALEAGEAKDPALQQPCYDPSPTFQHEQNHETESCSHSPTMLLLLNKQA
jgi:hypothetical protein